MPEAIPARKDEEDDDDDLPSAAAKNQNGAGNALKGESGILTNLPDQTPPFTHELIITERPEPPVAKHIAEPIEDEEEEEIIPMPRPVRSAPKPAVPLVDTSGIELEIKTAEIELREEGAITAEEVQKLKPYDPILDLRDYKYPSIELLDTHGSDKIVQDPQELENNKNQIITTLKNYDINIQKISATVGPTVTLYEIIPAAGVRISRIKNLEDDIALSLAALGIRIIAPIPGKGTIGIEVPNTKKTIVSMRTLLMSEKFQKNNFSLPIAIGKRIDNENFIVDLTSMPPVSYTHLDVYKRQGYGYSRGQSHGYTGCLYLPFLYLSLIHI